MEREYYIWSIHHPGSFVPPAFHVRPIVLQKASLFRNEKLFRFVDAVYTYAEGNIFYEFFSGVVLGIRKHGKDGYYLFRGDRRIATFDAWGTGTPPIKKRSATEFANVVQPLMPYKNHLASEMNRLLREMDAYPQQQVDAENARKAEAQRDHDNSVSWLNGVLDPRTRPANKTAETAISPAKSTPENRTQGAQREREVTPPQQRHPDDGQKSKQEPGYTAEAAPTGKPAPFKPIVFTPEEISEAGANFSLHLQAANYGYVRAQQLIAACLREGIGRAKNVDEAQRWMKIAAETSADQQQYPISRFRGECADRTAAFDRYMKAAKRGQSYAKLWIADCYFFGSGVRCDRYEAIKWYRDAASGNKDASFWLGYCYSNGFGVEEDSRLAAYYLNDAIEWYKRAAVAGYSEAQYRLGECYYWGYGVERDHTQAEQWFKKAAQQGNTNSRTQNEAPKKKKDYVRASKGAEEHIENCQKVQDDNILISMANPEVSAVINEAIAVLEAMLYASSGARMMSEYEGTGGIFAQAWALKLADSEGYDLVLKVTMLCDDLRIYQKRRSQMLHSDEKNTIDWNYVDSFVEKYGDCYVPGRNEYVYTTKKSIFSKEGLESQELKELFYKKAEIRCIGMINISGDHIQSKFLFS